MNTPTGHKLVLDTHRGIYFGDVVEVDHDRHICRMENARHCYYFPRPDGDKGTYSLATVGPQNGAKVGPPVTMTVYDVAKIIDATPVAIEAWKSAKWL